MKTWFIALTLLCAVGVAMANEVETEPAADQMATVAAPGKAQVHDRIYKHKSKGLPRGDLRHCLDLKTSKEIIRCSETRRKQ
jgi:hypothetical protein